MNWNEHLPALLLALPLLGAFLAPLCSLGGKTLRNAMLVAVSFFTLLVAFFLAHRFGRRDSVLRNGR